MSDQPVSETGGCQCGQYSFEIDAAQALTLVACHCTDCQKQSSSAFGMSLVLPRAAYQELSGALKSRTKRADSGREIEMLFCPECGTRIYHSSSFGPDYLHLKAGCLDDTGWLEPAGHIWTASAQPWVTIPADRPSAPGQPSGADELIAAWRGPKARR